MIKELSLSEIEQIDGGSVEGAVVVAAAVVVGAAVGVVAAPAVGAAVAVGAIAGAASAGLHALALWNAFN